jgi:dihydrofolate synthase/folylpolyglutamate synthase
VNERIQVGGEPISDEALAAQLGALAELERFVGVEASWFELMTAAAYRFFADEAVEAAVAEVGLGGRYDATNVADGTVSVVTNVDLDHTEILGESRSLIAAEKAGIVKKDAVVILGERDPDIAALFEEEARRVRASSVWHRGGEFEASKVRLAVGGRLVDLTTPLATYEDVFIPLHGRHQCDNAAAALAAAQAFVGGTLPLDVVREGLAAVKVPGRLEVLRRRPLVILDGAHNVAGARALASALEEDFAAAKRLVVVFGCLRNRQPSSLLAALNSERLWRLVACTAPSPRALPAADLLGAAGELGIEAEDGGEVGEAVERGLELTEEGDLLLVTGSLYVVGAARGALRRVPAGR